MELRTGQEVAATIYSLNLSDQNYDILIFSQNSFHFVGL